MSERLRILLVDDHAMLRAGLRAFLDGREEIDVVGEAAGGREAIEFVRRHLPDIVIMDVGMPELNGIETTRRLLAEDPDIRVIALSMHADERFVTGMFDAGARAYLLKACESAELMLAIEAVRRGRSYITPEVAELVISRGRQRAAEDSVKGPRAERAPGALTPREREVLQLIAEGKTSKEIAATLNISSRTAETHRYAIMEELDLHTTAELTRFAIKHGIVSDT